MDARLESSAWESLAGFHHARSWEVDRLTKLYLLFNYVTARWDTATAFLNEKYHADHSIEALRDVYYDCRRVCQSRTKVEYIPPCENLPRDTELYDRHMYRYNVSTACFAFKHGVPSGLGWEAGSPQSEGAWPTISEMAWQTLTALQGPGNFFEWLAAQGDRTRPTAIRRLLNPRRGLFCRRGVNVNDPGLGKYFAYQVFAVAPSSPELLALPCDTHALKSFFDILEIQGLWMHPKFPDYPLADVEDMSAISDVELGC